MNKTALYKGCLEPVLLKLLQDNGQMYGYEITQRIKELTAGEFTVTEGALYPLLHRLEDEGVLAVETVPVENRVRKYYSLTRAGKKKQATAMQEVRAFTGMLQLIFTPKTA
jgi:DNA-binding PadR family transcriptional regulator